MNKPKKHLSRRRFIESLAVVTAGGLLGCAPTNIKAMLTTSPLPEREYQGSDFDGWEVVVGDGIYNAPGENPVSEDDIETVNYGSYSELRANIRQRTIMAHNITFKRIIDDSAFRFIHTCGYKFKLPYLPSKNNTDLNGQTIEGGIFIWDGGGTRLDYGLAFQWIINPWLDNFGEILYWTGEQWTPAGYLEPDISWHEIKMVFDFARETTALLIDGDHYPSQFTETPKPDTWGTETAARLQAEIISLYPDGQENEFLHKAHFKDWNWTWEPYRIFLPIIVS
jgi:hypothetical protein